MAGGEGGAVNNNNNNKLRPHLPDTTPVGYCSAGKVGGRTPT